MSKLRNTVANRRMCPLHLSSQYAHPTPPLPEKNFSVMLVDASANDKLELAGVKILLVIFLIKNFVK